MTESVTVEHNRRLSYFATGFLLTFPLVYLYTLALVEAKYSVFLNLQPFRTGRPLNGLELALFTFVFTLEHIALLLGIATLIRFFTLSRWPSRYLYGHWLIPVATVFSYFVLVTIQFQVLRYFKDGVDLLVVRKLGGGDVWSALKFASNELAQLLPVIMIGLLIVVVIVYAWVRFGAHLTDYLGRAAWVKGWLSPVRLLLLNLLLCVAVFGIAFQLPVLNKNLGYSLVHGVYLFPWKYITDVDSDGYGLIPKPLDHAPFDSSLHPYAREIVGNGIDENGVGGDLAENIWEQNDTNWNPDQILRRNVLLIMLESARADLLQAKDGDQWVMPYLRTLPGQEIRLISHIAYTAPSVVALFNGVHSRHESGTSLIKRFGKLGYRTGIFSAQNEGFGNQDTIAGLQSADGFFDSRSAPGERMYLSSSEIASALPAPLVIAEFDRWLSAADARPFFAYINLQELHYPYTPPAIPNDLVQRPIPRYSIRAAESDWLKDSYLNTARAVDGYIADIVDRLKTKGIFDNTVILVVGDHGEELFDAGSLGHGTTISYEQNMPLGKLINAAWYPKRMVPIGMSEVSNLLHNALLRNPQAAMALRESALAFLGVHKPSQIGLFTNAGLTRYDFKKDTWTRQDDFGEEEKSMDPDWRLIHLWESYLLSLDDEHPVSGQ